MEALKATTAREITRASVTESETLVVNGVSISKPQQGPMQAGDFYFRPTVIERVVRPSWFSRVVLRKTAQTKFETVDTIVISCPACGLTTTAHRIIQRNPLTIDREIACPYAPAVLSGSHAFTIKDGAIMPA